MANHRNQQPSTLEQYVANRYLQDLHSSGFQPSCQQDDQPLEDALKIMAALNQAQQFIKSSIASRRATT